MKAEFELTADSKTGEPVIKFRHHDRINSLDQNLLRVFVDGAKERGIKIGSPGGYLEAGTSNSWENYVISVNQKKGTMEQQLVHELNGKKYLLVEIALTKSNQKKITDKCTRHKGIYQGIKEIRRGSLFYPSYVVIKVLIPEDQIESFNAEEK